MSEIVSAMQSSQWYGHFKGALYPINIQKCKETNCHGHEVKTLMQIAASFIVQDSTTTLQALSILPHELQIVLMQQALEGNKDRAVDVLLTKWAHPTLSLRKFAPDIFTSLSILYDHNELTKAAKQGLRYTTCMAHNFMESLKKNMATKLRFLDLTGFPTAEVITYYLATHCMLAHNEARQSMMIRKYQEAVQRLPEEEQTESVMEKFKADNSIPDDETFVVKFDAFLSSEHALSEVCKALKVSSFSCSTLKLVVEKLDVTCLGAGKIQILLEQINTKDLKGLRIMYNSLSSEDFQVLSPQIQQFTNITSLDLSCNCINVYQNSNACSDMRNLFNNLPNLTRLDLSNNRIKTKLRQVMSGMSSSLEFLRLAGCGLCLADLAFLAMSKHATTITELDISENILGNSISAVVLLLQKIQNQIKVLEMEDSYLMDTHMNTLISSESFQNLPSLMYLNLTNNPLQERVQLDIARALTNSDGLQYLRLSYPVEVYQMDGEDEEVEQFKRDLISKLGGIISKDGQKRTVTIIFSDLDQFNMEWAQ